jgi:hypothetical protein
MHHSLKGFIDCLSCPQVEKIRGRPDASVADAILYAIPEGVCGHENYVRNL